MIITFTCGESLFVSKKKKPKNSFRVVHFCSVIIYDRSRRSWVGRGDEGQEICRETRDEVLVYVHMVRQAHTHTHEHTHTHTCVYVYLLDIYSRCGGFLISIGFSEHNTPNIIRHAFVSYVYYIIIFNI